MATRKQTISVRRLLVLAGIGIIALGAGFATQQLMYASAQRYQDANEILSKSNLMTHNLAEYNGLKKSAENCWYVARYTAVPTGMAVLAAACYVFIRSRKRHLDQLPSNEPE